MLLALTATISLAFEPAAAQRTATDELTTRIIVVGSADEAERVVERLNNGESFPALARKVSIDPTADNGGLLKRMPLSALRAELRSALQDVGVGQITRVVRIPTGYAVLKVVPHAEADGRTATGSAPSPAVSAIGGVKYALEIGGLPESLLALGQYQKPKDWDQDPRTICQVRTQSLAAMQETLERFLSPALATQVSATRAGQAHYSLGQVYAYRGEMDKAIGQFLKASRIAALDAPAAALQLQEAGRASAVQVIRSSPTSSRTASSPPRRP